MRNIITLPFVLMGPLFIVSSLKADSITIATGQSIVATFDLTNYQVVCQSLGTCSTFPQEINPLIYTELPSNASNQYSVQAFFESTNDGEEFSIGTLPLDLAVNASDQPIFGLFRYNGGLSDAPFPDDPTFWGPNPSTATFQLILQNTGDPFTLLYDPSLGFLTIEDAVEAGVGYPGAAENSASVSITPEPKSLPALALLLAGLSIFRRKRALT